MIKSVKRIGFTGTQQGMTKAQKAKLREVLETEGKMFQLYFFHGDCIGADSEAHDIIKSLGGAWIGIFPPDNPSKRANRKSALVFTPMPYLHRNQHIASICDVLVATPSGYKEKVRGGTWATVRYARKFRKRVVIIFPDGTLGD